MSNLINLVWRLVSPFLGLLKIYFLTFTLQKSYLLLTVFLGLHDHFLELAISKKYDFLPLIFSV